MITIQIQENEAFDRLSVLEIKKYFSDDSPQKRKIQENIEELQIEINMGIGIDKAREIYCSEIYTELYNSNFKLFMLFNECKKGGMDALIPDGENINRHRIKNKLQEKFFGNKNIEIKLGY